MQKKYSVRLGALCEGKYGLRTPETVVREKLGTVLYLFPTWTLEKIREIGELCRHENMTFLIDEMFDRLNGDFIPQYKVSKDAILEVLQEYSDVFIGSPLLCEYGGLLFYWPKTTVAGTAPVHPALMDYQPNDGDSDNLSSEKTENTLLPELDSFAEGSRLTVENLRKIIARADRVGIKRPFLNVEARALTVPFICRAGMDKIEHEVTYAADIELNFSAMKGAVLAFGKEGFGIDLAMMWYGGTGHDELWFQRYRTSFLHAFLRGADPIWAEHGLMKYSAFGKSFDENHEKVRRFRAIQASIRAELPKRPAGMPKAVIAVMQGRFDGYVGGWQTHLWGQRDNEAFRLGDAERSWELFHRFYQRRSWQNRYSFGECDFSGNPPLGQVDVVPYDTPDEILCRYKSIIFLGRNVMDKTLYGKLCAYVEQGGELLLTSAHLDTADRPGASYKPFKEGDWKRLFGVTIRKGQYSRLPFGLKFISNAPCGWQFPLASANYDPDHAGSNFPMTIPDLCGAEVLCVGSDRWVEGSWHKGMPPVLTGYRFGKGYAMLVHSLDFPGAPSMQKFYGQLLDACAESWDCYPRVESSDRVRFAVYEDTLYLLNTEPNLVQNVRLFRSQEKVEHINIAPGEMHVLEL